jgi:hypothetical protein
MVPEVAAPYGAPETNTGSHVAVVVTKSALTLFPSTVYAFAVSEPLVALT